MRRIDARYDREQILEQAARARVRRQRRRAIALYRQVLAVERNNIEIHEKLAPLLAETGQDFDAWNSYRAIAHAALREGREDRAIAVFREASRAVPREIQAWQGLARLLMRQREDQAAVEVLIEGSRQFRAQWNRPQAIHLLRRARAIDPWHFETVVELARHLGRTDQEAEARMLLDGLAERSGERRLRRVRTAQLTVSPGPRSLLAWLLAGLRRPDREPDPEHDAASPPLVAPVLTLASTSDLPASRERERRLRRIPPLRGEPPETSEEAASALP
jgi:tetratricopeptide (TPR) repeat protein